jgi:hypothetical protein
MGPRVSFYSARLLISAGRCPTLDRIVFAEPPLNLFFLRGQNNTLPFDNASALTVLSHYVRTLIEHLDEALSGGSLEAVRGECGVMFLHLLLE